MTAWFGKAAKAATKIVHTREVQHDVALFVGVFIASGVLGDIAGHGYALPWDVLSAAFITAFRRALVLRLQGK